MKIENTSLLTGLSPLLAIGCAIFATAVPVQGADVDYPYGKTGTFESFVADSFRVAGAKDPHAAGRSFFAYMGNALPSGMDAARSKLSRVSDLAARSGAERVVCADLHKAVKKRIPKFSLDRGFDFSKTVALGERQCFLQSVVIASLLKRAGIPAGVVMVSRNEKGAYCNNGHAVTVARLSDGTDIIVDASDATPFIRHQRLMVAVPASKGYAYVEPAYDASHRITAYRSLRDNKTLPPSGVDTLDVRFLQSQFDYYRGERTPGGLFTPPLATPTGLAQSERWLRKSISECSRNPLSYYMLGKVQERRGNHEDARKSYNSAYLLYAKYGWVPPEQSRIMLANRDGKPRK